MVSQDALFDLKENMTSINVLYRKVTITTRNRRGPVHRVKDPRKCSRESANEEITFRTVASCLTLYVYNDVNVVKYFKMQALFSFAYKNPLAHVSSTQVSPRCLKMYRQCTFSICYVNYGLNLYGYFLVGG